MALANGLPQATNTQVHDVQVTQSLNPTHFSFHSQSPTR